MARYAKPKRGAKPALEKETQHKILKELEQQGCVAYKVIHGNKRGIPDVLACVKGRFVALEIKQIGREHTTTELQDREIAKIRECGGIAEVVCSIEEVKELLAKI